MSTLDEQIYIDAVIVKGIGRTLSVSIKQPTEETQDLPVPTWEEFDLTPYAVRMRILGSAEGDGAILLEKIITQDTDESDVGTIEEPLSGEFTFTITAKDTNLLGLGSKAITLQLLDKDSLELIYTLTEGGVAQSEFNKITVVRA